LGPSAPTRTEHITVTEAAKRLNLTPWDVMRLIETGRVSSVVMVPADQIAAIEEEQK